MTHPGNGEMECWRVPQSPFQIFYSQLVLEQIRLAVVDAYYLVPHGGVEIGGVLLGKYGDRQVAVMAHEPVECEHAFGPSFSLSPRDEERLKEVLAKVRDKSDGLEPVGWYHSHTRSEIFLTEADLEIHERYFPEIWQIALVVRPSTFQPARAGFFFRELGGSIHASASYFEFQLEPLRGRPALPKEEAAARGLLSNGNSNADPLALQAQESKPQPVIGSNPEARLGIPMPPSTNSPPPLERALTRAAIANPLLESGRLTADRSVPRARAAKPAANPQPPARLLAPAADARLTLENQESALTLGDRPVPRGERPVPPPSNPEHVGRRPTLTANTRPFLNLTPALVVRPALEAPAALTADPEAKLKRRVTPVADAAPIPKRPAATTAHPQPPAPEISAVSTPGLVASGSQLSDLLRFWRTPRHVGGTRVPVFVIGMVCLAVALGGVAYVARDAVWPWLGRLAGRVSPGIGPAMTINAIDDQEFQIRWDTGSPVIREARSAVLAIADGGEAQHIPLDGRHLQNGAFTFRKHSARVDVKLTIVTANGTSVEAATMLLGLP
jgi:proteasome lid subunit RPN8/RPN11